MGNAFQRQGELLSQECTRKELFFANYYVMDGELSVKQQTQVMWAVTENLSNLKALDWIMEALPSSWISFLSLNFILVFSS